MTHDCLAYPHRIVKRREHLRRRGIEVLPRHRRSPCERQRYVPPIVMHAWNDMHVVVEDILSRGAAAAHEQVHTVAARHIANHFAETPCHVEQVLAQRPGNVLEGSVVLACPRFTGWMSMNAIASASS